MQKSAGKPRGIYFVLGELWLVNNKDELKRIIKLKKNVCV